MARFKNLSEKPQKFKLFYPVQELEALPLCLVTDTHRIASEGGRKAHVLHADLGRRPEGQDSAHPSLCRPVAISGDTSG